MTASPSPVIETERLILRRPTPEDQAGSIAFMMSDRSQFVGGPMTRHKAWFAFASELGHWEIHGYGSFAVTVRGDDTCLGLIGPWFPGGWPEHEIGWLIWPEAEGTGFAYEAALATRAWAYRELGWQTAVSYIDPGNTRSIALAERLGAVRDDAAPRGVDAEDLVYRHPAPGEL
ncbi:MAG: GNAT family N-acetyltransferase [Pseudomonadota bacterium]